MNHTNGLPNRNETDLLSYINRNQSKSAECFLINTHGALALLRGGRIHKENCRPLDGIVKNEYTILDYNELCVTCVGRMLILGTFTEQ